MNCPHCEAPLQGNPRFCPRCGKALQDDTATSPAAPPQNQQEDPERGGRKKGRPALIGAIAAVLVVAIVGCATVFASGCLAGCSSASSNADVGSTDASSVDDTDATGDADAASSDADATDGAVPTKVTTYRTNDDFMEVPSVIKTYHANGTVASLWVDSADDEGYEWYEESYTYDEDGNLLTSSLDYGDSGAYTYSSSITYSYVYDSEGRPSTITMAGTVEEDGEIVDIGGEEYSYCYAVSYEGDVLSSIELDVEYVDSYGDAYVIVTTADLTVDSAGAIVQVDLTYTKNGNAAEVASLQYEHDDAGNVTKVSYNSNEPALGVISYCSAVLQPLSSTRKCIDDYFLVGLANDYMYTAYEYDELGNLTAYHAYDADGNIMYEGESEYSYSYDDEGRAIECEQHNHDYDYSRYYAGYASSPSSHGYYLYTVYEYE